MHTYAYIAQTQTWTKQTLLEHRTRLKGKEGGWIYVCVLVDGHHEDFFFIFFFYCFPCSIATFFFSTAVKGNQSNYLSFFPSFLPSFLYYLFAIRTLTSLYLPLTLFSTSPSCPHSGLLFCFIPPSFHPSLLVSCLLQRLIHPLCDQGRAQMNCNRIAIWFIAYLPLSAIAYPPIRYINTYTRRLVDGWWVMGYGVMGYGLWIISCQGEYKGTLGRTPSKINSR